MLPQRADGYIRRPHKLVGRGLVRLHNGGGSDAASRPSYTRRSKAGHPGQWGLPGRAAARRFVSLCL